VVDVSPS